jgi:hypothetical protein
VWSDTHTQNYILNWKFQVTLYTKSPSIPMYMMSFTLSKLCSLQFSAATRKLGEERKFQMSTCDWPSPQPHHDYPQNLHINAQAVLLCMPWINPFWILTCPLLMVIPLHHYTFHHLCSSNSVLNTQTVHLAVLFCMYHITCLGISSKFCHTLWHVHYHSVRLLYQTTFQAVPSTDNNNN